MLVHMTDKILPMIDPFGDSGLPIVPLPKVEVLEPSLTTLFTVYGTAGA